MMMDTTIVGLRDVEQAKTRYIYVCPLIIDQTLTTYRPVPTELPDSATVQDVMEGTLLSNE
jgi:hypothetical protein